MPTDTVSHALAHEERADRLEARVERLEKALREIRVKADAEMHYDVIAIVDAALTRTEGEG